MPRTYIKKKQLLTSDATQCDVRTLLSKRKQGKSYEKMGVNEEEGGSGTASLPASSSYPSHYSGGGGGRRADDGRYEPMGYNPPSVEGPAGMTPTTTTAIAPPTPAAAGGAAADYYYKPPPPGV